MIVGHVYKFELAKATIEDDLSSLSFQASGSIDLLSILNEYNIEDLPTEEEGTPEKYYNLIKVNPSLNVLIDFNEKLQNCDEDFISDFVVLGGLELLSETLVLNTRNNFKNEQDDLNIQMAESIETLLNEQIGLNEAMEIKNFFVNIALCLDNESPQVLNVLLKILAAGCCFGTEGHSKVINAFESYKERHKERKRFMHLVTLLENDSVVIKINVMALINAIVSISSNLSERVELRKEFLALGVKNIAHSLKIIDNEDLDQQLNIFLEEMEDDIADVTVNNVDISDPLQLTNLILSLLQNSPLKTSFVCIMHSLSLLPNDEQQGTKAWELVENFLQRILNLGNSTKLEFSEIKDLMENKIQIKEAKKKVGKLEEERKNLQQRLDNVSQESSKKLQEILETHQRELVENSSKFNEKLKNQQIEHKKQLEMLENKNKSSIIDLENKVDNANATISRLELELQELKSKSQTKIIPNKVSTRNLFQLLAHKELTRSINNLVFPRIDKPQTEIPGTKIFGLSLECIQARESNQIPLFFSSALKWIEKNAIQVEGIFRVSGESGKLKDLKERIDEGSYFFLGNQDAHVVAGIVKTFLRELPEPLIEKRYSDAFLQIEEIKEKEKKIEALSLIFILLSESRVSFLKYLLDFLLRVAENSSSNKMNASNLSIVFSPNILESDDPLKTQSKFNSLFEFIILNQQEIFEYPNLILHSYNEIVSSSESFNKAKIEFLEGADPNSANLLKMDQSQSSTSVSSNPPPPPIFEGSFSEPPPVPPPMGMGNQSFYLLIALFHI